MKLSAPVLLAGILLSASLVANAEELLLDSIKHAPLNNSQGLPRPHRGESMDQVRHKYGEPPEIIPRVGEPPITRWVYDKYTVYFENQFVINSVVHQP
jgi:hypothetical protein